MFARYLTFVFLLILSAFFFTSARAANESRRGNLLAAPALESAYA